jgi:DNA-binding CsgD family transcriptional regulator
VVRLEIYDAIWEPLGVMDSLRLYLGGVGETCRFFFFDKGSRGFPDRSRRLLDLLRPMLMRARGGWLPTSDGTAAVLSSREAEILRWVGLGLTNEEIGRRLWLSPHTVRKHLENTYRKLGVHNRMQAAAVITKAGTAAV